MEIKLQTGKLIKNISILNAYAPDSNHEFEEIKDHWDIVNNSTRNRPKNLIKCWRADNNGQPQHTLKKIKM